MKNQYLSIPVLAVALAAGTTAVAQTAKLRPVKPAEKVQPIRPINNHNWASAEMRGGPNDDCANAISITPTAECSGSVASYDAEDATESQPAVTCNTFTSPEARDLWFSFVANSAVTAIEVVGTLSFDAVIEGFSGSCGSLTSLGCADQTFYDPDEPADMVETLTMGTTVGQTYYVRVYSYWAPEPTDFTFTLCAYQINNAAPNDLCSSVSPSALSLGSSVSFTGDNTGALDTEAMGAPTVWHAFTTTECANISVDYCGTTPAFSNFFNALFIGCPYTDFVINANNDAETCPDGNYTLNFENVPAGTYYYAVIKDETTDPPTVGPYTLNVAAYALNPGYCEASATTCDESIAQVTLGSIDNISDCSDGTLADYTDQSTDFIQSQGFDITVTNGPSTTPLGDAVSVWVDWNQNESFCEANEVFELTTADEGLTFTGLILAPVDAAVGTTRMRVRMAYVGQGYVPNACGGAAYGEVEDYSINVIQGNGVEEFDALDWAVFPNPSNGDMTIRYAGRDSKVEIEMFDVAGRSVHQEQRQLFNGQQVALGLAGELAHGMYTLRLTTAAGRSEQRVIVQ